MISQTNRTQSMIKASAEDAFTLIELLVTIVILGIMLAPMVNAYVFAWETSLEARRRSQAVMLANWKIEETRAIQGYANTSTGTVDKASCSLPDPYGLASSGVKFECTYNVKNVTGTDPNFAAKKVDLKIYFPTVNDGSQRTINCGDPNCSIPDLSTYLAKMKS